MHLAIAGNIGVGKTYAAAVLSQAFGFQAAYETDQENPFLQDFYEDMVRWAFPMQVFLLNRRLEVTLNIQRSGQPYIQDRTLYEDAEVFAPVLMEMDILPKREYQVYRALYEKIASLIQPPNLLIYLRASVPVLVDQILDRGRSYEENISLEYLRRLNKAYEAWFQQYDRGPKVAISMDELHGRDDAAGKLVDIVARQIFSLF